MLPLARALRLVMADPDITFIVAPSTAAIPRRCNDIDSVITMPFPPTWPGAPVPSDWSDYAVGAAERIRGKFDIALLPNVDDPWSGQLVARAQVPKRIGFDSPRTKPFLTRALPVVARRHIALLAQDLLQETARLLEIPMSISLTREASLSVKPEDWAELYGALPQLACAPPGQRVIVLQPGSSWPLKNWPPANWARLCEALSREYDAILLVTGSQSEIPIGNAIADLCGFRARSIAGVLSLGGLAALLQRASLLIATDSGPLHLAGAVGCPAIGLYGPADHQVFGPWGDSSYYRIVRAGLPCSPCGSLWAPPCGITATAAPCITSIVEEQVLAEVTDMLG